MKLFNVKSKKNNEVWAILCAAGASRRMGRDKLMLELGGMTVLERSFLALSSSPDIDCIVVTAGADNLEAVGELLAKLNSPKLKAVVVGGSTRLESVAKGLKAVGSKAGYVAVHDGARPFVTKKIIADAVSAAKKYGAALPVVPVKDTIKETADGKVEKTLDRSRLSACQTPQVFMRELLSAGVSKALAEGIEVTDDAQTVELLGLPVYCVNGSETNIKITTPFDLIIAKAILEGDTAE